MQPAGIVVIVTRRILSGGLLALGLAFGSSGLSQSTVELAGGTTRIRFNEHLLKDLGVSLSKVAAAGVGHDGSIEFEIVESSVLILAPPAAAYRGPAAGYLAHQGGFELTWDDGRISLEGFELHPGQPPGAFELRAVNGTLAFALDNVHAQTSADEREHLFLDLDLRLSEQFAERLGRPRLAGLAVGEAHVRARVEAAPLADSPRSGTGVCTADYNGPVDVLLESISAVDEAHCDATRVALAPAVRLQNVGSADVKWFRPIAPDGVAPLNVVGQHPFLVMNLYRTSGDRIEQIGRSDAKHAFFSANTPPCDCQPDQVLFNDCTDVYGSGTNANRKYLAPRSEITASSTDWTTTWNKTGSHFDGVPVDDWRDHEDGDHPDGFEHRLSATVADLTTPGAEYRVEAWYVVLDDIDIHNSMGYRKVLPTPSSPSGPWTFPFDDLAVTQGSVLDSWVDPVAPPPGSANVSITTSPDEGELKIAVKATALPSGMTHYEYALMNFDFDRQIRSFSVPLPPGATVWDIWFGDQDGAAGNDWVAVAGATDLTWTAPAGNALDWGTMFNFAFDASADPGNLDLTMGVLEAGSPASLSSTAVAPSSYVPGSAIEVSLGGTGSGAVASVPAGISCASDCDEVFADGLGLSLAATGSPGSAFVGWEEGAGIVELDLSLDFLVAGDRDLEAVFETCADDLVLAPQTVMDPTVFHACESLTAGAGFVIESEAVFRAGSLIVLTDGFTVAGGAFRAEVVPEQSAP